MDGKHTVLLFCKRASICALVTFLDPIPACGVGFAEGYCIASQEICAQWLILGFMQGLRSL